jgi:hypothetical protein
MEPMEIIQVSFDCSELENPMSERCKDAHRLMVACELRDKRNFLIVQGEFCRIIDVVQKNYVF